MLLRNMRELSALITGAAFVVGVVSSLVILQALEARLLKIKDQKAITTVELRGQDIWLTGEFRKVRNCGYLPPVRGTDLVDGRNVYIISHSRTANQNWKNERVAQDFGPWQLVGVAGRKVKLYQEYKCHPLWSQFDELFIVDASDIENISVKVLE